MDETDETVKQIPFLKAFLRPETHSKSFNPNTSDAEQVSEPRQEILLENGQQRNAERAPKATRTWATAALTQKISHAQTKSTNNLQIRFVF